MTDRVTAEFHLPYFKQGDDLHSVTIKKDGKVDAKATLLNHIALLQAAIGHLQAIHDLIPDDNTVDLDGDTHMITITAEKSLIETLQKNDLVRIVEFEDEEDETDEAETEEDDNGKKGLDWGDEEEDKGH